MLSIKLGHQAGRLVTYRHHPEKVYKIPSFRGGTMGHSRSHDGSMVLVYMVTFTIFYHQYTPKVSIYIYIYQHHGSVMGIGQNHWVYMVSAHLRRIPRKSMESLGCHGNPVMQRRTRHVESPKNIWLCPEIWWTYQNIAINASKWHDDEKRVVSFQQD